jgi:hypothetical protein
VWSVLLIAALSPGIAAQSNPEPTPTPVAPQPLLAVTAVVPETRGTTANSAMLVEQLGGCVESGKLNVEIDLLEGSVPAAQSWVVETKGEPLAKMTAEARGGRVERLNIGVSNGTLLVAGKGLRPKVYLESLSFEDGKGITEAKFHGKGIWRPIVGIFRGIAMSALQKLEFRTDIPSVLRGEIFGSSTSKGKEGAAPTPTPTPGPSFVDLVREARVSESELVAYGGKPLGFGEMVRFETAARPTSGVPLRVVVDKGSYRPGHGGSPSQIDVTGRIDGEIENGAAAFGDSQSTFSHGELKGGTFHVTTGESGKYDTRIGASIFVLELTSGEFHLPGGPEVDVDPPSRVAFRDLRVEPDGRFSSLFDADLTGKVGRIVRAGSKVSASNIHLRTQGTRVVNSRASGDLELEFEYRLDYPLVVHYPMKEVGEKKVVLVFQGPFSTRLHYEDAGKDSGTVTGDYNFKAPWPPIEKAALEVLKARWSQDVTPAIRRVDFDIEPRRFSPCGESCFLLELGVTAEKKSGKKSLFRQICEPQGKADLVVDAPSRSFQLKNIRLTTRCKGVVGWVVNLIAPLLTKTYTDMTLFQMPDNLPFTIEKVGTGVDWVAIAGKVDWSASVSSGAASKPDQ